MVFTYSTKILLLPIMLFVGCAPMVRTTINNKTSPALPENATVEVFPLYAEVPDSCTEIGQIRVGDNGLSTECDYSHVIELAKKTARKAGGNIVSVVSLQEPDARSTCYRITAKILFRNNLWNAYHHINHVEDSIKKTIFGDNPKFAILHVYRPANFQGSLISYDVHLYSAHFGDTTICKAKNNSCYEIKLYKEGSFNLWAKTAESEAMLKINIKYGEEYFLRCGVSLGIFMGNPDIDLVSKSIGRKEYQQILDKK